MVDRSQMNITPPEANREYRAFFESYNISWTLRVLHPRPEVAIARDTGRSTWHIGAMGVLELRRKFTGAVFGAECFIDNSEETPEQTVDCLLKRCLTSVCSRRRLVRS